MPQYLYFIYKNSHKDVFIDVERYLDKPYVHTCICLGFDMECPVGSLKIV